MKKFVTISVQKKMSDVSGTKSMPLKKKKAKRKYRSSNPFVVRNRPAALLGRRFSAESVSEMPEPVESTCIPLFSNPALETLMILDAMIFKQQSGRTEKHQINKGSLEVSYQSIHFCSSDNSLVITLPFVDIESITEGDTKLKIIPRLDSSWSILVCLEDPKTVQLICQLFKLSQSSSSELEPVSRRLVNYSASPEWKAKQESCPITDSRKLMNQWNKYFAKKGQGSCTARTAALVELISQGIPNSLRCECCGVVVLYNGD